LEAKRRRAEEEATLGAAVSGEEEAWLADERMHKLLKTDERLASDRNGVLLAPAAVRACVGGRVPVVWLVGSNSDWIECKGCCLVCVVDAEIGLII
jgi:hypothetical protein